MRTTPQIVDRETWLEARRAHLADEKAFTAARDELSAKRRALPWVEIDGDYTFEGPDGPVTLAELFDGKPQLVVQHFMYGTDWDEGCPSCSFWADGFDGITVHLAHRNTAFALVSNATIDQIEGYRRRMGWDLPWVSAAGTTFNADMAVSHTPEQIASSEHSYNFGTSAPMGPESAGVSVFNRSDDGRIHLSYQTFARGLDLLNTAYNILDLTPLGRDEDDLPFSMAWLHRHDDYPD